MAHRFDKRFDQPGRPLAAVIGALGVLVAPALAGSLETDSARRDASALRAQPIGAEPAWFVERADNSSMRISVLAQTRYMISERNSGFIPFGSETTYGFSTPRTRIALDGSIVSSQFSYRISLDFGDAELSRGRGSGAFLAGDTGMPRLLDAYGQYNFGGKREGTYLKFGQFQNILLTEEAIDSAYQQVIDRSLSSELFGPGYTQGIALGHVDDNFAFEASFTDGGRYIGSRETDNTPFDSVDEADMAFGLRLDLKLEGAWDQFADFSSFQASSPATKVGGGLLYQFQGQWNPGQYTPGFLGAPIESGQMFTWTLDYQHEGDGWNFFAAYIGQYSDWEIAEFMGARSTTLATLHNAVVLQGGWFLTDRIEVYSRFETFWIDKAYRNGFGTPDGYIHRIGTLGATHYFLPESHAAKLSADISYAFDSLYALSVGSSDTLGLPDPNVTGFQGLSDHELVFRVQLQLMF